MSLRNKINLTDIQDADRAQLDVLWKKMFGNERPSYLPRHLTTQFLTYATQERALGGLKNARQRQLDQAISSDSSINVAVPDPSLSLGTRLVRGWGGENHEVMVLERGFAYRGQLYRSLSEVARVITGVRWSGPRFFNTKSPSGSVP